MGNLRRELGIGQDRMRNLLAELSHAGYLQREKRHGAGGRWDWESTVWSESQKPSTIGVFSVDGQAADGETIDGAAPHKRSIYEERNNYGKRNINQLIDHNQNQNDTFSIRIGWEPSGEFWILVKRLGYAEESTDYPNVLTDFISYWLTRPGVARSQVHWEKTFLHNWKRYRVRNGNNLLDDRQRVCNAEIRPHQSSNHIRL